MATPKTPQKRGKSTGNVDDVALDDAVTLPQTDATAGNSPAADEISDAEVVTDDSPSGPDVASKPDAADAISAQTPAPETAATAEPEHAKTPEQAEAEATATSESKQIAAQAPDAAESAQAENLSKADAPETENTMSSRLHLEATPEASPAPAPKPRSVFVPMLLGGVVAAGIGFGLAKYGVPDGWPITLNNDAVTALEAKLAETQAKLAENSAILAKNEANLAGNTGDIADMKAKLAAQATTKLQNSVPAELKADLTVAGTTAANALETANNAQFAVDELEPRLKAVEQALAALQNRPTVTPAVDAAVIDQLTAEVGKMRTEVEAQKAAADAAAARVAQEVELARAGAEAKAQATMLRAAAAQVQAALQSGVPFAEPLAQLVAAGTDIPAPLPNLAEKGAPTVSALKDSFGGAARAALDVTRRENVGQSVTERITSFLKTQTGARSLTPHDGNDSDAVLSRAEDALRKGDLPAALALIATLPASAQAAMAAWVTEANTLLSAQDAARKISAALSER